MKKEIVQLNIANLQLNNSMHKNILNNHFPSKENQPKELFNIPLPKLKKYQQQSLHSNKDTDISKKKKLASLQNIQLLIESLKTNQIQNFIHGQNNKINSKSSHLVKKGSLASQRELFTQKLEKMNKMKSESLSFVCYQPLFDGVIKNKEEMEELDLKQSFLPMEKRIEKCKLTKNKILKNDNNKWKNNHQVEGKDQIISLQIVLEKLKKRRELISEIDKF